MVYASVCYVYIEGDLHEGFTRLELMVCRKSRPSEVVLDFKKKLNPKNYNMQNFPIRDLFAAAFAEEETTVQQCTFVCNQNIEVEDQEWNKKELVVLNAKSIAEMQRMYAQQCK
jgi:hypothetical protein